MILGQLTMEAHLTKNAPLSRYFVENFRYPGNINCANLLARLGGSGEFEGKFVEILRGHLRGIDSE